LACIDTRIGKQTIVANIVWAPLTALAACDFGDDRQLSQRLGSVPESP